jgi:ABC-2 type transport system ATP-binding protein
VTPLPVPDLAARPVSSKAMDNVVELHGVRRSFRDVLAISELHLTVGAGRVVVLLGPNGAGKTTIVRIVTGALGTDQGEVRTFGIDPTGPDGNDVRARIGVVPAKPALYDRLTGEHNMRYSAELYGVAAHEIDDRVAEAATRFGIAHALTHRVGGYSTGMKARLALARAVLHDPDLLLLDEPTAGLDPESARAVLALIDEMAAGGKSVLMCTHLLLEAEGLADEIVVMDNGRALVAGAPRDLTNQYWPASTVILDAEDRPALDRVSQLPYVLDYQRNGSAIVELDSLANVADMVDALVADGVRVTRVEPRTPSLEELYFAIRRRLG